MATITIKVYASGGSKYPLELQGETETIDTEEIAKIAKEENVNIKEAIQIKSNQLIEKWQNDKRNLFGNGISKLYLYDKKSGRRYNADEIKFKKGTSQQSFIRDYVSSLGDWQIRDNQLSSFKQSIAKLRSNTRKQFFQDRARSLTPSQFKKLNFKVPTSFSKYYNLTQEEGKQIFERLSK